MGGGDFKTHKIYGKIADYFYFIFQVFNSFQMF